MQTRTMPMVLRSRLYLLKENLPDSIIIDQRRKEYKC